MFALPMEAQNDQLRLLFKPYSREESIDSVQYWTHRNVRNLGQGQRAQTKVTQAEWYDKLVQDELVLHWGIYLQASEAEVLVGNTSLTKKSDGRYESGIYLWRSDYWGRGIASLAHMARTHYAVQRLNAVAIDSVVYDGNTASAKAIERIGYVQTGTTYGHSFDQGQPVHSRAHLWVNPSQQAWSYFWGDTNIPKKFVKARKRSKITLKKAGKYVSFL